MSGAKLCRKVCGPRMRLVRFRHATPLHDTRSTRLCRRSASPVRWVPCGSGNRYTRGLIFAARQYSRNVLRTPSRSTAVCGRADPLPCWTVINMSERSMLLTFQVGHLRPAQARGVQHDQQRPVQQVGRGFDCQPRDFFRAQITGSFFGFLQPTADRRSPDRAASASSCREIAARLCAVRSFRPPASSSRRRCS